MVQPSPPRRLRGVCGPKTGKHRDAGDGRVVCRNMEVRSSTCWTMPIGIARCVPRETAEGTPSSSVVPDSVVQDRCSTTWCSEQPKLSDIGREVAAGMGEDRLGRGCPCGRVRSQRRCCRSARGHHDMAQSGIRCSSLPTRAPGCISMKEQSWRNAGEDGWCSRLAPAPDGLQFAPARPRPLPAPPAAGWKATATPHRRAPWRLAPM